MHLRGMKNFFDRFNPNYLWWIIGLAVLTRLAFMAPFNLLPEEAYYWSYAQHLDIGYLDHPPMVAWLIHLSETILGRSEFATRLPAFLGWFVMACFMFRIAEDIVGKGTGRTVILLLSTLPIYWSVGFLMTPDAPFYVCWAGALFFLSRAMLSHRAYGWYGTGVCLGLGLLSKYTMGLIVPATLCYMLIDEGARRWFKKPQPYIALIIGFLLFLPVLYWNAQHEWASFAFQGTRRWSGGTDIRTHILFLSILVLITPLGFYEAARVLTELFKNRHFLREHDLLRYRSYLFLATFTVVPLTVFVVHSIQGSPKLNWTGPVWMAILPLIAARITGVRMRQDESGTGKIAARWLVTAMLLLLIFTSGLSYLLIGMPGIVNKGGLKLPLAWQSYGARLDEIESRLKQETNSKPITIGLDEYWLASEASFYEPDLGKPDNSLPVVGGSNLVGGNSLMWNFWVKPETISGRNAVLVSFTEDPLNKSWVTRRFVRMGQITREALTNARGEVGYFYWRAGYDYRPD